MVWICMKLDNILTLQEPENFAKHLVAQGQLHNSARPPLVVWELGSAHPYGMLSVAPFRCKLCSQKLPL